MAKQISRTFETHTINVATVELIGGEIKTVPCEPIVVFNQSINNDKAIKLAQKNFGKKQQYVVTGIETEQITYALDLDKFLEMATIVENKGDN